MSRPLAHLLEDLFFRVAEGCPGAWRAIAERAEGLSVHALVGDESMGIRVGAGGPAVRGDVSPDALRLEVSLPTLRALIVGDIEVVTALRDERLRVYAGTDDLARLHEFVRYLVAGAARARGVSMLFDEFHNMADDAARVASRAEGQSHRGMT